MEQQHRPSNNVSLDNGQSGHDHAAGNRFQASNNATSGGEELDRIFSGGAFENPQLLGSPEQQYPKSYGAVSAVKAAVDMDSEMRMQQEQPEVGSSFVAPSDTPSKLNNVIAHEKEFERADICS